ncbi:hypothetical protein HF325_004556 [Metschnikowia pulcherrima]|uniref:Uncharacterized protein n=1 Tax=Metschnikowia pulcherrima TaxID=27326 RepID=A0A8H7GPM1_9ASCO|nr:hypothetical protein HF325_004556 [Metschnikowia pulcherrima]
MARAPKLLALIFTAIVGAFFVFSRSNGAPPHDVLSMALLHLDDGYILYFQPEQALAEQYDTLVHGLSFRLEYTDKVYKALGSESVPQDVVQTTDERLFAFLRLFKADALELNGVKMTLERDKTVTTQEDEA